MIAIIHKNKELRPDRKKRSGRNSFYNLIPAYLYLGKKQTIMAGHGIRRYPRGALPTRVSHAACDYTGKTVLAYFDSYTDGTEELDRCTKRAVDYLTIHRAE